MNYNDLRDVCRVYRLPVSRYKDDLIKGLHLFANTLFNFDEDEVDRNESSKNSKSNGYQFSKEILITR